MQLHSRLTLVRPAALVLALFPLLRAVHASAQATPAAALPTPKAVLVELFTSEGCSSCPPADELLRQISGHTTTAGQLIVGLSEHVSYWNGLGWRDPYSSEQYTARQSEYGAHFGLDSVYTPQMVVNGREQFVGGDRHALVAALHAEAQHTQIALHIVSAQVTDHRVIFKYSAADLPAQGSLDLVAVLVDDMDRSSVLRGENSGRELIHVSVARALAPLGKLQATEERGVSLPLPASYSTGTGHHLVIFAQQAGAGSVVGIDTRPI